MKGFVYIYFLLLLLASFNGISCDTIRLDDLNSMQRAEISLLLKLETENQKSSLQQYTLKRSKKGLMYMLNSNHAEVYFDWDPKSQKLLGIFYRHVKYVDRLSMEIVECLNDLLGRFNLDLSNKESIQIFASKDFSNTYILFSNNARKRILLLMEDSMFKGVLEFDQE